MAEEFTLDYKCIKKVKNRHITGDKEFFKVGEIYTGNQICERLKFNEKVSFTDYFELPTMEELEGYERQ